MKYSIQNLTITAFMAAIICIMGPIVIPIGMVPMSFASLAIYFTVLLLDKKKATISVIIYLLIGLVGLPVFSGFAGGPGRIFGPTGGYLLGYPVLTWISGSLLAKCRKNKKTGHLQFFSLMLGTVCLYVVGTIWLMKQGNLDVNSALSIGVYPFVIFDILKILVALMLGDAVKKRLRVEWIKNNS